MRMVRNLNEKAYEEIIEELEKGFEELSMKYNHFSPGAYPRPTRINVEGRDFPFPLAAEIYHVYLYLVGEGHQPEHMYETTRSICDLVWFNPFTQASDFSIEWERWERTKIGFFVRCSFIAMALENGEPINSKQLSLMAGISPTAVIKQIKEGKLKGEKYDREWSIQAEDALTFLKLQWENSRGGTPYAKNFSR
ncbi:hypothetical protein SAMN02799624_05353 [Paenibacillus sp. UNC496MF]|uniref:hypothetical protein n=1 Tax=Paenibacillus sp. UNC496MF TaxID=1502753 RepID=UPI0008EB0259|nr:hypothetical protein [Paenibacillus sp. UNC496MF]SFJ64620.1 hypothetical protein SAMN02799624_05353 [Paenibacillus sp. UNC496MF]